MWHSLVVAPISCRKWSLFTDGLNTETFKKRKIISPEKKKKNFRKETCPLPRKKHQSFHDGKNSRPLKNENKSEETPNSLSAACSLEVLHPPPPPHSLAAGGLGVEELKYLPPREKNITICQVWDINAATWRRRPCCGRPKAPFLYFFPVRRIRTGTNGRGAGGHGGRGGGEPGVRKPRDQRRGGALALCNRCLAAMRSCNR